MIEKESEVYETVSGMVEEMADSYFNGTLYGWLNDRVLECKVSDFDCYLLLTFGGPTIYLHTMDRMITGLWGKDRVVLPIPQRIVDAIEEYCRG